INVADYNRKYNELKEKYAKSLIDIWTENTDPLKFIFEDIGIAAYLLLVWEKYDKKAKDGVDGRQCFVDVGCGNGLLVYILNSEGYRGYGVDIRSRKIWTHLKPNADLRVQTVVPTDSNLFEDARWLIGNHSDELTPWIPVMAARSKNKKCQYFLIPCCPWDFTGKFSQSFKSKPGKYEDYLNFIHEVGEICGFDVLKDILRIPSTRRTCFIGLAEHDGVTRKMSNQERLMKMESYITSRKRASNNSSTDADFKPRDSVEKVKNAAAIDRKLIERIWMTTLNELLKTNNYVPTDGTESKKWNRGGTLSLSKLSEQFSKDELNVLKSECGGLQTVLKNCPDVFASSDWSSAEFAEYIKWRQNKNSTTNVLKIQRDQTRKTKICFYYEHHPDGCPLSNAHHCRFAHGSSDLSLNN
ncbi:hypothetical protein HELRODRAFT_74431, partial [Helobdella robusta]|uniref:tRNA (uracil-O(2)-)-methyltransferase n=1 Tax=Helobdella robusta TaxID=6412 RepID=T1G1Q9_HELRO